MSDVRHEFAIEVEVHSEEIDELNHVNNAVYLQYVEQVARAHSDAVGFPIERFLASGAVPVVRRHAITYHAPARDGERLRVHTRIQSIRGVRAIRVTMITRGEELVVDAETEWVWVDPSTSKVVRIPAEIREAFVATEAT